MKIWLPTLRVNTGADIFTQRLAKGLQNHGIEAEITWFNRNFEFFPSFLKGRPVPTGTTVIHANSWNGFAFRRQGLPLVVTQHNCVADPLLSKYKSTAQKLYHSLLINRFERLSFESAAALTTVSSFTAQALSRCGYFKEPRVIYNSVDLDRFIPLDEASYRGDAPFRLLFIGSWSKGSSNSSKRKNRAKGLDLLFPIMERLGDEFTLTIVADVGNDRRRLLPNMQVSGRLDETSMARQYQQCHALITPSRYEGFGYTALEAMACGRPVIATNNTALPEVVGDTGLLCDVDSVDQFVDATRHLRNNPDEARRLGIAARERAVEHFSEEKMIEQYVSLYRSVSC
jgi:glycosyltransferase involved in cell wall biosynthesis